MSRSHIRIKSLISVRMAAEMYKTRVCSSTGNTPSSSEIASRENGSDGRLALGRWSCVVNVSGSNDERRGWGTGSLRASETLGSL
jgi:hypothetical protein